MQPSGDQSSLDIGMNWASTRFPGSRCGARGGFFPKESFGWIAEAGRTLRTRPAARRRVYQGRLMHAHALDRPLLPDIAGKIVVAAEVDGNTARVHVDLEAADFQRACAALPVRRPVSVTGVIRHDVKMREYELSEPTDFRVLEAS